MPLPLGTRDPASNPLHRNQILIEIFDLNSQSHQQSQVIDAMFQKLIVKAKVPKNLFVLRVTFLGEGEYNWWRLCYIALGLMG